MKPLVINEKRSKDLDLIVSLGQQKIKDLEERLRNSAPSVDSDSLLDVFIDCVGSDIAPVLMRHAASLCLLSDERDTDLSEVVLALRSGLEKHGWTEEKLRDFDQIVGVFESLISSENFYTSIKAIHLFSTDSNHLHEFKIYTESRPVFDRDRKTARGSLIFSTLSVVWSDAGEKEERAKISLGYEDLKELIKECETAIQKIHEYEATLNSNSKLTVLVYGRTSGGS